jgi:hypothetical protein
MNDHRPRLRFLVSFVTQHPRLRLPVPVALHLLVASARPQRAASSAFHGDKAVTLDS